MRRVKKDEEQHIASVGPKKFEAALARASLIAKQDARLIGLDKARSAIAFEAALQATGYEARPFSPPKSCGEASQEFQDICEAIFAKAKDAAAA